MNQFFPTTLRAARVVYVLIALGVLIPPIVGVYQQVVPETGESWTFAGAGGGAGGAGALEVWSLVRTVLWVSVISLLAVLFGLPAGWMLRRNVSALVVLVLVPLLMPMYLVFAGWGLLRGPGTWVGDALGRAPPGVLVGVNKGLAVVGLALWAWPIAALVIGVAARRVPTVLMDALALEPASIWRRGWMVCGLLRNGIMGALAVVGLIMLGSAIPLHLAQVRTYAIDLWTMLSISPDIRGVWIRALPLVILAGVGGLLVFWGVSNERGARDELSPDGYDVRVGLGVHAVAGVVWMMSVVVPLVLFGVMLRHGASVGEFWKFAGWAVARSAGVGVCVGVMVATVTLLAFASLSAGRGVGRVWIGVVSSALIGLGLVPGMLIGVAGQGFWNAPWMPASAYVSIWPLVWAHVARFSAVGVVVGIWLAGRESEDERSSRVLMAGESLLGWWVIRGRPALGVMAGVGCAAAALSLHEIEAAVTLQAPGPTSVAQYLLEKLHYARDEQLCAACLNLLAIGLVLAGAAAALMSQARELRRSAMRRAA